MMIRRVMLIVATVTVLLVPVIPLMFAQSPVVTSLNPRQAAFFDHFFMSIGNLEDPASVLARREAAVVRMYGLSPEEATTLRTVVQDLQTHLRGLKQRVNSVVGSKQQLTDLDQVLLRDIGTERRQLVQESAIRFLMSVLPTTTARFSAVDQPRRGQGETK